MHASIRIHLRAQAHSDQNGSKPAQQRSVVLLPGLGNNAQDYAPMAETLRERGLHVQTAAVARADWYLPALETAVGTHWGLSAV